MRPVERIITRVVASETTSATISFLCHHTPQAEARKSPVVDGIVLRDEGGKEQRFTIILSRREKEIARRLVLAFRQNICGFDILRSPRRSCVCDVNGFSLSKMKGAKFVDDVARLLQLMVLMFMMMMAVPLLPLMLLDGKLPPHVDPLSAPTPA